MALLPPDSRLIIDSSVTDGRGYDTDPKATIQFMLDSISAYLDFKISVCFVKFTWNNQHRRSNAVVLT
jgi:hypothetical protein